MIHGSGDSASDDHALGIRPEPPGQGPPAKQPAGDHHAADCQNVNHEIGGRSVVWMEEVEQGRGGRCRGQTAEEAVKLGRSGQAFCNVLSSTNESGSEMPTMNRRQIRASLIDASCVPGTSQLRRHPTPLAAIQSRAAGSGNSAQYGLRSGTLV